MVMRPVTVQGTINAIVGRSLPLSAPLEGGLALISGKDGRFRLEENLEDHGARRIGVWARDADGHRLPVGHVLTRGETERIVRTLLGLSELELRDAKRRACTVRWRHERHARPI